MITRIAGTLCRRKHTVIQYDSNMDVQLKKKTNAVR